MMAFFQVEGPVQMERGKDPSVPIGMVSPDYFKTMGIPLLQGRTFTEQDVDGTPGVVIINESMARKFWPDENPIGKRIGALCEKEMCRTIVGVVGDVRHEGLTKDLRPEIYLPYLQIPLNSMAIVIRTSADPMNLVAAARSQIQAIDPDQPVSNIRTLEQHLADSVAQPRLLMSLLSAFAALALVLAAVGIYGVISYSVAQRTHEIGIRMALGAETGDVLRLVLGRSMALVIAGIAVGLGAAMALTKVLSNLLFSVSATDPVTFILVSALLALVALAASYIPARRATKVDPMVALRYE
jgi:putative ABC transport system permease protein